MSVFQLLKGLTLGLAVLSLGARAQAPTAPNPSLVSDPQTLLGPQATARGGATAASILGHDALFQNPATGAFQNKYAINFAYLGTGDALAASIVDTKSGPMGGGVYYLKRDFRQAPVEGSPVGSYARSEERAGFSFFGKFNPSIGFGANVKYGYRRSYTDGVANVSAWNFDLGGRFILSPDIAIGIVGQNMMTDLTGLNPKTVLGGLEFRAVPALMLSAQLGRILGDAIPSSGPSYGAGAEYILPYNFLARLGYRDTGILQQRFVTAGFGYESASFGVNYSFQQAVGSSTKAQIHSVGVSGYL